MARQRHTPEQIIAKLPRGEIELSKGKETAEVCRLIGVHEPTYYRWREEFGGMAGSSAAWPSTK